MSDERVVYSFKKNKDEEVRATIGDFKGKTYVSLRVYVNGLPTKKGLTVGANLAQELLRAAHEIAVDQELTAKA